MIDSRMYIDGLAEGCTGRSHKSTQLISAFDYLSVRSLLAEKTRITEDQSMSDKSSNGVDYVQGIFSEAIHYCTWALPCRRGCRQDVSRCTV
jgi:hypothetical protein